MMLADECSMSAELREWQSHLLPQELVIFHHLHPLLALALSHRRPAAMYHLLQMVHADRGLRKPELLGKNRHPNVESLIILRATNMVNSNELSTESYLST